MMWLMVVIIIGHNYEFGHIRFTLEIIGPPTSYSVVRTKTENFFYILHSRGNVVWAGKEPLLQIDVLIIIDLALN
jgi:hypothetical protein